MHSPLSTEALANLRAASVPSPCRKMSMTPSMTARGAACTPPGPVTGHASTHLPQRVQASSIASTRPARACSNVSVMRGRDCPWNWNGTWIGTLERGLDHTRKHGQYKPAAETRAPDPPAPAMPREDEEDGQFKS